MDSSNAIVAGPLPVPRLWQERWKAIRVGCGKWPGHDFTPSPLWMKSMISQVRLASDSIAGIRAFLELQQIAVEIHRRAGAGRHDHRQVARENPGGMAGDFPRGPPVAGVERGLAAAGLVVRKFDGDAEMFEHLDGGAGDVVVKGVAQAGAHQKHPFVGRKWRFGGHAEWFCAVFAGTWRSVSIW